jgi:mono/diheme cytochrome c family protein
MAVADGVVYAPVVNLPTTFDDQETYDLPIDEGTGEMVALDLETGEQLWSTEFEQPPYGAATVVNDLVFTTIFSGELLALDRETGEVVWREQMPAGTNATVAVSGGTVVTAASFALGKDERPQVIAYRLGASGGLDEPAEAAEGQAGEEDVPEEEAPLEAEPEQEEPAAEEEGDEEAAAPAEDGQAIFTDNCASCHILAAAGSSGTVGPNLDQLDLNAGAIASQVENGGGGMPAFGGRLSPEQIRAVAEYVAGAADPSAEPPAGGGGGP